MTIELFHHLTHTFDVERFGRAVRALLEYYTENFGSSKLLARQDIGLTVRCTLNPASSARTSAA